MQYRHQEVCYNYLQYMKTPLSPTFTQSISSSFKEEQETKVFDYSRKWLVLASVSSGTFLATIDGSIVNIALPVLQRDLATSFAVVEWVALGYMLTVATLMLMVGRLSDIIGKKLLYMSGFVVFTIGSALCGFSQNIGALIAFRVFQGVGAVMLAALGTAIITEAFPPQERGMALGLSGLMVSIGLISGPAIGGMILGSASWQWIFFVNLPIGVIGTIMVWRFVPQHRPSGREQFDFWGAFTLFVSLLSLLLGLTLGQQRGFTDMFVLLLLLVSVIALVMFYHIEKSSLQPMIDLRMFDNQLFSVNLITGFITFISAAGVILLMPYYLQNVLGYQPYQAGLLLAVFPLAMGLSAPFAGWMSDRWGTRRLTALGLFVLLLGYLGISTLSETTTMQNYILLFLPLGVGMGIFQSPNNSAIMGSAAHNRLGIASGLLSLTRSIGQTIGLALMGAIWAAQVHYLYPQGGLIEATQAPSQMQVLALQRTLSFVCLSIAFALALSLWALWKEKRG